MHNTRHPNLLSVNQSLLLIIDVQEKFRPHILRFSTLVDSIIKLARACLIMEIPIAIVEQYPAGLGNTVTEITNILPNFKLMPKTNFSCCQEPLASQWLQSQNRKQIIVCGIEAHVCVNQTVHDLLNLQYNVHIITDAISARAEHNLQIGINKMHSSGAILSSLEMALFELVSNSKSEYFKAVQNLVK